MVFYEQIPPDVSTNEAFQLFQTTVSITAMLCDVVMYLERFTVIDYDGLNVEPWILQGEKKKEKKKKNRVDTIG